MKRPGKGKSTKGDGKVELDPVTGKPLVVNKDGEKVEGKPARGERIRDRGGVPTRGSKGGKDDTPTPPRPRDRNPAGGKDKPDIKDTTPPRDRPSRVPERGGKGEPTRPTRPGGKGESTRPTRPGGKEEPTRPTRPGGKEEPTQPTSPGGKGEPTRPTRPGGKGEPTTPSRPGGKGEPTPPTRPGGKGEPTISTRPGGKGDPVIVRPDPTRPGKLDADKLDFIELTPRPGGVFRPNTELDGMLPDGKWAEILGEGLRPGIFQGKGPILTGKDAFAQLDPAIPVTLFPIRLETVFSGDTLKIRVFPDDIHVQDHDPTLTDDELEAGRLFWEKVTEARANDDARAAAEVWLTHMVTEERAVYVAEQTLGQSKPTTGKRKPTPAHLGCLPKFWRAVAYKRLTNGTLEEIKRTDGAAIPDKLAFDLLQGETETAGAPAPTNAVWLHDFAEAKKLGMGLEINLASYKKLRSDGIALLLVYGVGPKASTTQAKRVGDLFATHRYSQGAAFQAQGVPTNLVNGAAGGMSSDPAASHGALTALVDIAIEAGTPGKPALLADTPKLPEIANAARLGTLLGQPGAGPFARMPGADRDEVEGPRWMNEALWPVTWGAYLDDLMKGHDGTTYIPQAAQDNMRQMWRDDVRGGGPLPALRVGRQPYGILPVRAHNVPKAWVDTSPWLEYMLVKLRDIALAATPQVPKLTPGGNGQTRDEQLATVVEVLSNVPHPIRFLARDLRDWRTESTNDLSWLLLAAFGMVWLAGDDPTYDADSRSIMGQWGWAQAILTSSPDRDYGVGLHPLLFRSLEGENVTDGDDQIDVLQQLRSLMPTYASGKTLVSAYAWIDYMIRQVEAHSDRLEPYRNVLTGLPLANGIRAMMSPDSDDPLIGWSRYSETAREVTQALVQGRDDDDGLPHRPSVYLAAAHGRVSKDTGSKPFLKVLDAELSLRPLGGSLKGVTYGSLKQVSRSKTAAAKTQVKAQRGRTAAAATAPIASVTQPTVKWADRATAVTATGTGTITGIKDTVFEDSRVVVPRGDGPLLKQLVDAAAARVPNGQRNGFRAALDHLQNLPPETLAWHMRETLGLASNRLDAWLTGLATRRMREMDPKQTAQIGGYGFVLDLKPDPTETAPSTGFIHAPTMQQASTAGILRSGWENHGDQGTASPLAVNLTSKRLRAADRLIQSVSQGLKLGSILGQDFERALHDANLDVHLDRMRKAVLAYKNAPLEVKGPLDGLDLVEAYEAGALSADLLAITSGTARKRVEAAITATQAQFDALGDAGLAEATHYLAQGNAARAAAILDAISMGEAPPSELRHARTDIAKSELVHHVCLSLTAVTKATPKTWTRASHHPALDAYVAGNLPDISNLQIQVVTGETVIIVPLTDLGLSPLDLVLEGARPGVLGQRAMLSLVLNGDKLAPGTRALSSLIVGAGSIAPDLEDFEEFCVAFASHLGAMRPQWPSEMGLPQADPIAHLDRNAIAARIAAHHDALTNAAEALNRAHGDRDQRATLTTLDEVSRLDMPQILPGPDILSPDEPKAFWDFIRQAHTIIAQRIVALEGLGADSTTNDLEQGLNNMSGGTLPAELVWLELKSPMAIAPSFNPPNPHQIGEWIALQAHVHEDLERFARARDTRALIAGPANPQLVVRQFSASPQTAWLGTSLPQNDAAGGLSWICADGGGLQALKTRKPYVGYVIDGWTERLPAKEVTTGLAIQHDAPSSRAPQSILLAVTPDDKTPWSDDLLARTLIETLENAQVRAVTPSMIDGLGHHLPAIFVPGGVDAGPQPPDPDEES